MQTRRYGEFSVLHIEPETYARLLHLADTFPGRPGGARYDPDDPWHGLIVEPHAYGCWVHTGIVDDGDSDELPASLIAVLRDGHASDADYVLFDADLEPSLDLPCSSTQADRTGRAFPGRHPWTRAESCSPTSCRSTSRWKTTKCAASSSSTRHRFATRPSSTAIRTTFAVP